MTVSVNVSVNGNYKLPVTVKQGAREESFTVSGRGHSGPNVRSISFYHGPDPLEVVLGPEEPDNGETEPA